MHNDTIAKVLREICDMQAENYGNGTDTHIDLIALCARGREALASSAAPTSEFWPSYVQVVPDKCDRIIWRGAYYHLPLTAPAAHSSAPSEAVAQFQQDCAKVTAALAAPAPTGESLPVQESPAESCSDTRCLLLPENGGKFCCGCNFDAAAAPTGASK